MKKPDIKKYAALLFIAGLAVMFSCMKDSTGDMTVCTTEYRMIMVSVRDSLANPVILGNYFVKKTSTGEILDFAKEDPFADSIYRSRGMYIICTDGKMGMTSANGTEFEFHGFLGTAETVNEKYVIGHDRCHIQMISGKKEIVISK